MEGVFSSIEISGSGMSVQRRKMNVVAENIANAETVKGEDGGPYRRKRLQVSSDSEKIPFKTLLDRSQTNMARTHKMHMTAPPSANNSYERVVSAKSREIQSGPDAYRLIYDPSHPEANEDGYVKMPDIEIVNEMVDMISANRAYEANAMAISASKEMLKNALDI
jgi:flagellar basal-body rod protein FlgC